jgi:cell wall-associated NlpC family hydrolase
MPGFLLLNDAEKTIGNSLNDFGQNLLNAGQSAVQTVGQGVQDVQQSAADRLNSFGQDLLNQPSPEPQQPPAAAPEVPQPAPTPQPTQDVVQPPTPTETPPSGPSDVVSRLTQHGLTLLGEGLQNVQQALPSSPGAALMTAPPSNSGGSSLSAPDAQSTQGGPSGQQWLQIAQAQLSKPYIWGSKGGRSDFSQDPAGFDCSGFVSYVMKTGFGVDLPAFTGSAYQQTRALRPGEQPRPGDVVFYNMDQGDPHLQHIALYTGNGQIIQAGGTRHDVNVASANQSVGSAPEYRRPTALDTPRGNELAQNVVGGVAQQATSVVSGAGQQAGQVLQTASDRVRGQFDAITQAASRTGVPSSVIAAIMDTEDGGPRSLSPAGAAGFMQVMPQHFKPGEDPFDPVTNIRRGAEILADNYQRLGSWDKAAAAYFGAIDAAGNIRRAASDVRGTTGGTYVDRFLNSLQRYAALDQGQDTTTSQGAALPVLNAVSESADQAGQTAQRGLSLLGEGLQNVGQGAVQAITNPPERPTMAPNMPAGPDASGGSPGNPLEDVKQKFSDALDSLGTLLQPAGQAVGQVPAAVDDWLAQQNAQRAQLRQEHPGLVGLEPVQPLDFTKPLGPQVGFDPYGDIVEQGVPTIGRGLQTGNVGDVLGGAAQTGLAALGAAAGPAGPTRAIPPTVYEEALNRAPAAIQDFLRGERGSGPIEGLFTRNGAPDLDALAQLREDARRQVGQPPPAPPPESAERLDWLTGRGKWAEPETAQASLADKAIAVGVNGMLGNTNGMVNNALSGIAENVYRPLTTALVRGELGPAWADVRAQGAAVGDALADLGSTFVTGRRPSRLGSTDYPEAFPGWKGALPFTTGNIRVNAAFDEFNRALANAGGQAAELARLKGANPEASVGDLISQYRQQLLDAGVNAAKTATFEAGGTPIGDTLARARARLTSPEATPAQRLGGLITQMIIPFSKIPDVILTRGVLNLPGVAEGRAGVNVFRALRSGDRAAAGQAVRQLAVTEAVNAGILHQVLQGNITGSGPDDPAKRSALQNARDADGNPIWQANSLRIPTPFGVRWVPYSSLGPVAIRLAAIANAVEQYDEQGKQVTPDFVKATSKAVGETISDAWYLQGLSRIFQALKNGTIADAAGNTLLDFGERYVPDSGFAYELRQFTDPTVREPQNPLQDVANRVPGLSMLVPPRINPATGEPTQAPRDVLSGVVRASAPGAPDPVNLELARHNLGVGDAPSTISQNKATVAITPDEQRAYQQIAGAAIAHDVQATVNSPSYQRMTLDQQRKVLADVVAKAREYAGASVWKQLGRDELVRRMDAYEASRRAQSEPAFRAPVTVP